MNNLMRVERKYDRKKKVNSEYMAKEDSLNILQYSDLMFEVEKQEKRCHRIQKTNL